MANDKRALLPLGKGKPICGCPLCGGENLFLNRAAMTWSCLDCYAGGNIFYLRGDWYDETLKVVAAYMKGG